ncbi:hypothetical protein [Oerskovia enterophila]|uniref:hypothetical protein n=1 Tax=Oerskovia enterophila TaxID=43678 RepID=UPI0037FDDEE2
MSKTRTVVTATALTTKDGRNHKVEATVTLPDVEARDLIRAGLAREAASPATAEKGGN